MGCGCKNKNVQKAPVKQVVKQKPVAKPVVRRTIVRPAR